MLPKYKPSGKFGPALVMLIPALGALQGASAWGYSTMQAFPVKLGKGKATTVLEFLLLGVLGILVYVSVTQTLKVAKCRNAVIGAIVGVVVATVPLVTAHYVAYERSGAANAAPPVSFGAYMNRCVVKGWDANPALNAKFKHLDPWEVWIFWGLEAAVILGAGFAGGVVGASRPFCETCGLWALDPVASIKAKKVDEETVNRMKKASSVPELLETVIGAEPMDTASTDLELEVIGCPGCSFATASVATVERRKKHKKKDEEVRVVHHSKVLITPEEREIVVGVGTG